MSRFHAWWEGEPPSAALARAPDRESVAMSALDGDVADGLPTPYGADVAALELMWGAGRIAAGSADDDLVLTQSLALSKNSSVAWLGAGLGAPPVTLARERGLYVTAFERRAEWLDRAKQITEASKLGRKLSVEPFSEEEGLGERKYEALCGLERLNELSDPAAFLKRARGALKPSGLALVYEMVCVDPRACAPAGAPGLRTLEAWRKDWEAAGYDLRVVDEVSAEAAAREKAAWPGFVERLDEIDDAAAAAGRTRLVLARAIALFAASQNRLRALERGDRAVYRFLAARAQGGD